MVPKLIYSVIEGYITISQEFFHQNKELLLLTIRILVIINGMQELSLIDGQLTDTMKIYTHLSQFVITNHLIVKENSSTLIYLSVLHALINIICFTIVYLYNNNKHCQFLLFLLVKTQHLILIIPTWKAIIYQISHQGETSAYLSIIFNFTMYIQYALWVGTCKQTQLIDFTGFFSNQSGLVESLNELLSILAIILSQVSNNACSVILIIKYISTIYFLQSMLNHNSLFIILFNIVMINFVFALKVNIQFIYFLVILSFTILVVLNMYQRFNDQYLVEDKITLQKCQIIEYLQNNKCQKINSKIKLSLLNANSRQIEHTKQIEQFLSLLVTQTKQRDSLNAKILCNYTSQIFPLKSLIQFHQHYFSNNILHKSYLKVITCEINKQLLIVQDKQKKKNEGQHLAISEFLITQLKSSAALDILEKTIKTKLTLLEHIRLGFSYQDSQKNTIKNYVNQVWNCKQFVNQNYDMLNCHILGQVHSDILTLRIIQLYSGIIMANMKKAIDVGKLIEDLMRLDKQFIDNSISNQILLTNRSLIIQTSLIHEKGQLLNYNKAQAAIFFNAPLEQVGNYQYIYEFMPNYVATVHDDLINEFIFRGTSKLMETGFQVFVRTPQNYIQPVFIHLFNPLQMDDITLYSIITQSSSYFDFVVFDSLGVIQGMTSKFCNFIQDFSSELNLKFFNVNDIMSKGGHILHYIPQIASQLYILQQGIKNSQNYQLSNLRAFWELPVNNIECVLQTQYLINSLKSHQQKLHQLNEDDENYIDCYIENLYINILDPNFQFQFQNICTSKTTYKFSEVKQKIELSYTIQIQRINQSQFFIIQIQDYRITDSATTLLSSSQNKSNAISLSTQQLYENVESERISSEGHQIQQIQIFNNLHQRLLVEKLLYDDPEIDCDGILDKNSSKQINCSQNQSKTPFIFTQRQTHRQLLSGQISGRGTLQRTEFILPQLSVQEHVNKDYDILNQLERDMIEISHQVPKDQAAEPINEEIKLENECDFLSKSLKTSKTHAGLAKFNYQKSNLQQLESIREIVDRNSSLRFLANVKLLTQLLEVVIILTIIIKIVLLYGQFDDYKKKLSELETIQQLNNYVTSTYQMIQSKYLQNLHFTNISPYLAESLNSSLAEVYFSSIENQFTLEIKRCFLLDQLDPNFGFETCFIYYGQLQDSQLSYFRNGILQDNSYNFTKKQVPSYFQYIIYDFVQKFFTYTNELITNHSALQLSDAFVAILIICLLMIIIIYIFIFRVVSSKAALKYKLISLLSRLTQQDIIDQIAFHTIIVDCWKTQQWKLYNFYDLQLQNPNEIIKDGETVKTSRKNNNQQDQQKKEKLLLAIIGLNLFCLLGFFIVGFILLLELFQSYLPSVTINQQFLQFQLQVDQSITLGQIIKAEPLLYNFRNSTEQAAIIKLYFDIVENLPQAILDIINSIIENENQFVDSTSVNEIIKLMNSDFCSLYNLPFCKIVSDISRKFENESYAEFVKSGINGIATQISSFSISEFQVEKETQLFLTDIQSLKQTISQQLFTNIYIEYILDIQTILNDAQTLLLGGNTEAGNQIIKNLELYYLILGPSLMIAIFLITMILINRSNVEISKYKYLLLMIPEYKLDNSVVKQKILNIRTYFF